MATYRFSLDLRVHDTRALYAAALEHAILVDELTAEDAKALLGTPEEPFIDACLIMLMDPGSMPGCDIYGSETTYA